MTALAAAADGTIDPDAFCDRLLELLFPDGDPADDIALLAVAWGARSGIEHEPTTPEVEATPAS